MNEKIGFYGVRETHGDNISIENHVEDTMRLYPGKVQKDGAGGTLYTCPGSLVRHSSEMNVVILDVRGSSYYLTSRSIMMQGIPNDQWGFIHA